MARNWPLSIMRRTVFGDTLKPNATSLTVRRRAKDLALAVSISGLSADAAAERRWPIPKFLSWAQDGTGVRASPPPGQLDLTALVFRAVVWIQTSAT